MSSKAPRLEVQGVPYPQGSKTLVRGRMVESCQQVRPWRAKVTATAKQQADHEGPLFPRDTPLAVSVEFRMPRPKAHYRANGAVKPGAPAYSVKRPDLDKLMRAVGDALSGVWWEDDSQIVSLYLVKVYTDRPGNEGITVTAKEVSE